MTKYDIIKDFHNRIESADLIIQLEKIQEEVTFSTLDNITASLLDYLISLKVENLILKNVNAKMTN